MAESIVATAPEQDTNAELQLEASIDAAGALVLSFDGKDLADANGNFEIECDREQVVKIIIANFEHGGETWTLAAAPKTRSGTGVDPWEEGQRQVYDDGSGHMNDYVTVDVTATASTSKSRPVHVKTKPRHSQPDPQMQQGG